MIMIHHRFLQSILALSFLLLDSRTSAFSARKGSQLSVVVRSQPSTSVLFVGAVWTDENDNDAYSLMNRATACADGSESCSLEEAQSYLDDVLTIQKDCQTLGSSSALCEDVGVVSEVVANLRQKIALLEKSTKQVAPWKATVHLANLAVGVYVVSTILHGFAAVPNVPVDAPVFTSFGDAFGAGEAAGALNSRGVATILPVEWFWAIRDGYFPALFSEWIRNGGLVVDTSAFENKAVAFTPQEWVWSIQNGSFGHLLEENMKYGGFRVDAAFDNDGRTPMNGQDVLWSIQGGYLDAALKHFYRNGGV